MNSKPIPIRLDDETIARLDAAAERFGSNNRSAIIKLAIFNQLPSIERGLIKLSHHRSECRSMS